MKIKILESIEQIPQGNYIGYYWYSGAKEPVLVNGFFNPAMDKDSLYIQEAMLWDVVKKISVMLQYTHRLIITCYYLSEMDLNENCISYQGHRLGENKRVKFYRHWEEVPDLFCADLPVLKMKAQIFVGFE